MKPNAAQLAVLIHHDGGPTPQQQGRRPTADTLRHCRLAGWIDGERTTTEGRDAIRLVLPDYVSPRAGSGRMQAMPANPDLLQALTDAHAARLAATRAELEAVAALRNATPQATWQEIANAVGLGSRQQAEKKYGRLLVEETPARYRVADGAAETLRLS